MLASYHWPGNIRELQKVIEDASMHARDAVIDVAELPPRVRSPETASRRGREDAVSFRLEGLVPLAELQRRYTIHVVERSGGNKTLAARRLGISRSHLHDLLRPGGGERLRGNARRERVRPRSNMIMPSYRNACAAPVSSSGTGDSPNN